MSMAKNAPSTRSDFAVSCEITDIWQKGLKGEMHWSDVVSQLITIRTSLDSGSELYSNAGWLTSVAIAHAQIAGGAA